MSFKTACRLCSLPFFYFSVLSSSVFSVPLWFVSAFHGSWTGTRERRQPQMPPARHILRVDYHLFAIR